MPLAQALGEGLVQYIEPDPPYFAQIARLVDLPGLRNAGLKVVVDSMYGAGIGYFPALLAGGNTRVTELNNVRNPTFPGMHNPEPIARNLAALTAGIAQNQAHVGLATDGDADRIGLMDENGVFINQLQVFALLLLYHLEVRGKRGPVVKTVTTTAMAHKLAKLYDIPVYETPVGFKYVGPTMMETGATMAGAESGGVGFAGHIPERDGIWMGLTIWEFMAKSGKSLDDLIDEVYAIVGPFKYERNDLHISEALKQQVLKACEEGAYKQIGDRVVRSVETIDGYKFHFDNEQWMMIRASGTEPVLRCYAESDTLANARKILADCQKAIGA